MLHEALRNSPSPRLIARSAAGPNPILSPRAARGPMRAADAVPGSAGPSLPAPGGCSARSASRTYPSAMTAGRGACLTAPGPDRPRRRSLPCAESWGLAAPLRLVPSDAEFLAPFRTAAGKHSTTALRRHAGAEAMFPLPGALLGLVGPLHRCVPVLVQGRRSGSVNTRTAGDLRQPHAIAELARPVSLCPRILPTRRWGCQTCAPLIPVAHPISFASWPLPGRKGCCYTTATPEERPTTAGSRASRTLALDRLGDGY